jgi:hypothetical protein
VPSRIKTRWLTLLPGAASVFAAIPAQAHGFGQRYDLPIPLSFYVFGAGATVAFSFVVAAAFLHRARLLTPIRTFPCCVPICCADGLGIWRPYCVRLRRAISF